MRSYYGSRKNGTVHHLVHHAISLTKLQWGLHSTDTTRNTDKPYICKWNTGRKGGSPSNVGVIGSSSLPSLQHTASRTPTAPRAMQTWYHQLPRTPKSYSPIINDNIWQCAFLQTLPFVELPDDSMFSYSSALCNAHQQARSEPTTTLETLPMEPAEWTPRKLPVPRR